MSQYGNYKPNFILEDRNSFLGRLKHFWSKVKGFVIRCNKSAIRTISVALVAIFLLFASCKTKEIPVEVKYETRYTDSVVMRDSVVITPIEQIVDIVPWYDTLFMSTSISESKAWVDTNYHILQGRLVNKQGKIVEIKYIDKVQVRDSIVVQEKPVYVTETVEKIKRPWWSWVCLTWTIITILSIAWGIYKKIKPI